MSSPPHAPDAPGPKVGDPPAEASPDAHRPADRPSRDRVSDRSSRPRATRQGDFVGLRIATRGAIALGVLLLGVGVFMALVATGNETPRKAPGADARRVLTMQLEPVTVSRPWRGYGTAEAVDSADVPARVTATVAELPEAVREGQRVRRGDVLARLDPGDFQRDLDSARERLADLEGQLARLDVERRRLERQVELETEDVAIMQREQQRMRGLVERRSANQKDLDDTTRALITAQTQLARSREALESLPARRRSLEAQLAGQRSGIEQAEANLTRSTIVAPIDGILESVDVEVGEQVTAGSRVARVVGLSTMEVGLALPASARGSVVVGDRAVLASVSDGQRWEGQVGRVSPRDDTDVRTVTVYVDVEQPGADRRFGTRDGRALLTPGVFVSGWAIGEARENCWVVPRRSVREGRLMVVYGLGVDGLGMAKSVPVDVAFTVSRESVAEAAFAEGMPDADWVVVAGRDEPLRAGLSVLVTPPSDLRDGAVIEPLPMAGEGAAGAEGGETAEGGEGREAGVSGGGS
jgi:RND family efflux transporter MFP subunit